MNLRRFLIDTHGAAATEFALLLPILIIVMFGGSEAGHFVWTQHKLTEAVRDGARFASRLSVDSVCNGATEILSSPAKAALRNDLVQVTRTGQIGNASARPVVPGWTAAQVQVTVSCQSFVNTGIYADLNARGPIVTVRANNVTYPSLFNGLGVLTGAVMLNAKSSAAVIGI